MNRTKWFLSTEDKLKALAVIQEIGNVRKACETVGISRSNYYRLKKIHETSGPAGLHPQPRRKPAMPNAFSEEVVKMILEVTAKFPSYSSERISRKLKAAGVKASGSGVRKVWKRRKTNQENTEV